MRFYCFLIYFYMKGITKKIFFDFCPILTEISQKSFLGIWSCNGWYNLGLDCAILLGVCSKWPQRQGLKTDRELFLFWVLKIFLFWKWNCCNLFLDQNPKVSIKIHYSQFLFRLPKKNCKLWFTIYKPGLLFVSRKSMTK